MAAGIGKDKDWDATSDAETMSRGKYNLVIGLTLVWGFLIDAIICSFLGPQIDLVMGNENGVTYFLVAMVACLVIMILGIVINVKSDKPSISFLGYNMAVIPMGVLLTFIVSLYDVFSVLWCFVAALLVSAVMCIVSTIKPEPFRKMGFGLLISLLVAVVVEIVVTFVLGHDLKIFDWVIAIIFCGYIGFDWVRAQDHPATLDNAIDSACALYVDIVNLFIRLLEIFGRSK